jgi:hypothetical protein
VKFFTHLVCYVVVKEEEEEEEVFSSFRQQITTDPEVSNSLIDFT